MARIIMRFLASAGSCIVPTFYGGFLHTRRFHLSSLISDGWIALTHGRGYKRVLLRQIAITRRVLWGALDLGVFRIILVRKLKK